MKNNYSAVAVNVAPKIENYNFNRKKIIMYHNRRQ